MGTDTMHLLDVTLSDLQRRNRAAFVRRGDIAGAPVLRTGEKVVLRDERGEYFAGTVVDCSPDDGDDRYLLHVGVRLPEEYAYLRLGRSRPLDARRKRDQEDVQSVLDALGEARAALRGTMPRQRFAT